MGLAAAVTVGISVLAALTLLPAMLGFLGRRLRPTADPEGDGSRPGLAVRWARLVTRHPIPVIVVTAVALLVVATPAIDLRLGLPDDSTAAPSTTQRKAYDILSANFVPGINGPLVVVVDASGAPIRRPPRLGRRPWSTAFGIAYATAPTFDKSGKVALLQVNPFSGPSSTATETLVRAIRAASGGLQAQTGATLAVTGATALNIDTSARMQGALLPYLAIVVGLAILLLAFVFRSVLVPIKAAAGFVLSLAATLGAVVAVFQWGWLAGVFGIGGTGPVLSLLPMLVVAVVFGLAMDYEVFLVSRMREEHALGAAPTAAVVTGFAHGAKVVTAAALIMISVFAGFILSADPLIKAFGFALVGRRPVRRVRGAAHDRARRDGAAGASRLVAPTLARPAAAGHGCRGRARRRPRPVASGRRLGEARPSLGLGARNAGGSRVAHPCPGQDRSARLQRRLVRCRSLPTEHETASAWACGSAELGVQRPVDVGPQVLDVLDADRHAAEGGADDRRRRRRTGHAARSAIRRPRGWSRGSAAAAAPGMRRSARRCRRPRRTASHPDPFGSTREARSCCGSPGRPG